MTGVRRKARTAAAQAAEARYEASGAGRRIARWNPSATGPRKAQVGIEKLLSRARDAVRNEWAASNSSAKWSANLVGTGIQPVWQTPEIRAIWDEWSPSADADGVLDAYGLQVLGARALFEAGEVFLRARPRRSTSPLGVPVQVQMLEAEMCPHWDTDVWPGLPPDNKIRQGVEFTRYGERAAYWFYKEHPGDGGQPSKDNLVRVAASMVSHVFEVRRPGQVRGVSDLASVLTRLKASGDLEDAVLDRQKIANLFALFITRPAPPDDEVDIDPLTGLPKYYGTDGAPTAGLEPGISQELRPGEDVKFATPPSAGVAYSEYLRSLQIGTAAGQGLPYELMSGDIQNVSDRTLRIVMQEFRRYCQQRQWITLIPRLCQPMVTWCMETAALRGVLPASMLAEARRPTWRPQGWEYIHPVQDAQGKQILYELGVISKSQIIAERGDDPQQVFDERQADSQAEQQRGLNTAPAANQTVAQLIDLVHAQTQMVATLLARMN